jgi:2',3'-cyclic-nucleotide 2'-phosphodiesterase (5'-nucleotidase family)
MKKSIRLLSILIMLALLFGATSVSAQKADPPGQLVQLQLLAFNDYHGHVLPNDAGAVDGVVVT